MKKIFLYLKLPLHRKILLIQALILAIYVVFIMYFTPSKARFGKRHLPDDYTRNIDLNKVFDIRFCIRVVAANVPFRFYCRHEAYLAKLLCTFCSIPYKINIGVHKNNFGILEGHAWTMVGEVMISGFCKPSDYQVIDCFYG